MWDKHSFCRLRLHTKIVLTATAGLLLFGFGWTLLFEWSNPATLGAFDTPHKLLAAAFESVTLRTAGFNTIDLGALTGPSQAVSCLLMFIGGSPGSTAGGIKTVTAAVLVLTAISAFCGRTTVRVRPDDCAAQHHERRNPAHGRRRALSGRRLCDRRNRGRTVSPRCMLSVSRSARSV